LWRPLFEARAFSSTPQIMFGIVERACLALFDFDTTANFYDFCLRFDRRAEQAPPLPRAIAQLREPSTQKNVGRRRRLLRRRWPAGGKRCRQSVTLFFCVF
jgi:hypothetical protein